MRGPLVSGFCLCSKQSNHCLVTMHIQTFVAKLQIADGALPFVPEPDEFWHTLSLHLCFQPLCAETFLTGALRLLGVDSAGLDY